MYSQLYIYVEGTHDISFFQHVIKPLFENNGYDHVVIREYNGDQYMGDCKDISNDINNFIHIDENVSGFCSHYLFITDRGCHPCVTDRKDKIKRYIPNIDEEKIVVVVVEIESWYLAGLDKDSSRKLRLPYYENTDTLSKSALTDHIPQRMKSEIAFRQMILDKFSVNVAILKNQSFKYFFEKYISSK